MAQKKTKEKEWEIYLTYTEDRSDGEICEGQEDDGWPSYEDGNIEFYPKTLSLKQGDWVETIRINFEPKEKMILWLVIPRYFDGGTFGRTKGYWTVHKVCTTEEDALQTRNDIYADRIKDKDDNGQYVYIPWKGYFAGLEYVEIHKFILDGELADSNIIVH